MGKFQDLGAGTGRERDLLFIDLHGVLMPEGGVTSQEFEYQYPQRPPVYSPRVALVLNDLGGEVFGSSAERIRLDRVSGFGASESLRKTKVNQLDVTVLIEEEVLGL